MSTLAFEDGLPEIKVTAAEYEQFPNAARVASSLLRNPDILLTKEFSSVRPSEYAAAAALSSARKLKEYLSNQQLNIVTAESLTAGMICKTLIDIPAFGAVVYGGFNVYDTDAKRRWLDVSTQGVYSHETAQQMAIGALNNSQAMLAIAVTGQAMTYFNEKQNLGIVHVGFAARTAADINDCIVRSIELRVCDNEEFASMCDAWKQLTTATDELLKAAPNYAAASKYFPPAGFTSVIADYIRQITTARACDFALMQTQELVDQGVSFHCLDDMFPECAPSSILNKRKCSSVRASNVPCDSQQSSRILYRRLRSSPKHWDDVTTANADYGYTRAQAVGRNIRSKYGRRALLSPTHTPTLAVPLTTGIPQNTFLSPLKRK